MQNGTGNNREHMVDVLLSASHLIILLVYSKFIIIVREYKINGTIGNVGENNRWIYVRFQ